MKNIDFNCFGIDRLKISFNCEKCNSRIEEEIFDIPEPDYLADSDSESQTSYDDNFFCPSCGKEYNYEIYCGMYSGGNLSINGLSDDVKINIEEIANSFVEAIADNENPFETFKFQMSSLEKLMKYEFKDYISEQIVKKLIYANIVTCMETYLSDVLINSIFNNEKTLREFVENNPDYKGIKFPLSEIYKKYDSLKYILKDNLSKLVYHRLKDVEKLFDALSINFPDYKEIQNVVIKNRHDIIHRNGKDTEGKELAFSEEDLSTAYNQVYTFIETINKEIKNK